MTDAQSPSPRPGPIGRLALWCVDRMRIVAPVWIVVFLGLGALAPSTEDALSEAGWEASGSASVDARRAIEERFPGQGSYSLTVVVSSERLASGDAAFDRALARVRRELAADRHVARVLGPGEGGAVSPAGNVVILRGAAGGDEAAMVTAAGRVGPRLEKAAGEGVDVAVTGLPGLWSDINETSKSAMIEAELRSWPLTLAVMLLAFGSLVAAGMPLALAILGLGSAIGALFLLAQLGDITIWAVNFSLMFALAVGIDYALFVVARFRAALRSGLDPRAAVVLTMDTAGKAVLLSGITVLAALLGLLLIPSPPFQTTALGIILAVSFVLAASLTLLPGILVRIGPRIDRVALPWKGAVAHRSEAFARWAALVWRRPLVLGAVAVALLGALLFPLLSMETAMPTRTAVPEGEPARDGADQIARAFGAGAGAQIDVLVPRADAARSLAALSAVPGIAAAQPAGERDGFALLSAVPGEGGAAGRDAVARMRAALPAGAQVGGAAAETHDLERMLSNKLPLLYGAVLGVGFLLLLVAVRAPVVAAAAVLLNLLATGAAFGVAKLIFQDGALGGFLGFEGQGYVTAWGPIFFFTLIFALAMDYTVFLLASIKEHHELTGDARAAAIEGLATSGRVVNAAAAVMVFVFFTFAMAEPLPPKEMGTILGIAVLLDATLVRLLLLPVVLRLLGDRAWRSFALLDRVLPDVRFSHGAVR